MTLITQKELKDMLYYSPSFGIFVWKKDVGNSVRVGSIAGTIMSSGYIQIQLKKKRYLAHRLAFLYQCGFFPKMVDHRNGSETDNSWDNLRECTNSQNQQNRKASKNNTSGVKGVFWSNTYDKWLCRITIDGRLINLGMFDSFDEAVEVMKEGRKDVHGEFARH